MAFYFFKRKKILTDQEQLQHSQQQGCPAPPPHIVKQKVIKHFCKYYHLRTLVETGTFQGDMVEAQKASFDKIYSIELSQKLYKKALQRFRGYNNIEILQGDSGDMLTKVVSKLTTPALFWLDGHYSGGNTAMGTKECPVPEELHAIFTSSYTHIVLIDDARLFNGIKNYPTIKQIADLIKSLGKNYSIAVNDDIIRLTPASLS